MIGQWDEKTARQSLQTHDQQIAAGFKIEHPQDICVLNNLVTDLRGAFAEIDRLRTELNSLMYVPDFIWTIPQEYISRRDDAHGQPKPHFW